MYQEDRDFEGPSPPDYDSTLCEQQTVLLNRINVLTHDASLHDPPKSRDICTLKERYNRLVKERAEIAITPLSDPMEALPCDLWPEIIRNIFDGPRYPVDKLLDLTSVSKGWCSVLTTLPVIWTCVELDQCEPDYLAKAMMCIQLSGECEIDLNIRHLTLEEWRGVSCMIIPEGRRIRRFSFSARVTDYMVIRQVLGGFTKLPVLEQLFLPYRPSELSDQQYIHALLTEKMPLIKRVYAPNCTMQDQIWNPYLVSCSLEAESLTKNAVEMLMLVPDLRSLIFTETAQTLENIPSLLNSSFGSVMNFTYKGADICRRLIWIGNSLRTLSTHYPENGDSNALLVALSHFPHLHEVTLIILSSSWGQEIQNNRDIASPHNSIRVLSLQTSIQDQFDADWDVFFSIFFPASPCLEELSLAYGLITYMGWSSIQTITNLRLLHIFQCNIGDSSSVPLISSTESLRQVRLAYHSLSLTQLLARLQSKFLQNLCLIELQSYPLGTTTPYLGVGISFPTVTTTPYIVAGAAFPNITSLVLSSGSPVIWGLRALSKLRELELRAHSYAFGNHIMYWVSDVLEAILKRPRDNPALEKITLTSDFVEWDILILMLERRNFLNESGISSIKTLVVNYDLPYRLLYPLSELLGGRFVERDSNESFSPEAIGERVLNESLPGCMHCHYIFRNCESLLIPRSEIHPKEAAGGDKEDHVADEYLVADPPLPLEITLWLSGRRKRLINFMRRYEETGHRLHRPLSCGAWRRESVITGDVLVGAHFGHDLHEYDTGVDV